MKRLIFITLLIPVLAFSQEAELSQAYNKWAEYQGAGDFSNALPWAQKTVELAAGIYGHDHEYYGSYTSGLAMVYRMLEDYESSVYWYKVSLSAYEKSLGKEHEYYATVAFSLGVIYQFLGDVDSARDIYIESREIYRNTLGEAHPYYIMNTYSLGYMYLMESKYLKAMPYLVEWEQLANEFLDPSRDMAISLNNVGSVFENTGDYNTALSYYYESLKTYELLELEDDFEFLKTLANIGGVLLVMGDYYQAETVLLDALELSKKQTEYEPILLIIMDNLGTLYYELGQFVKAESRFLQALERRKKAYGEEDEELAISYNFLAMLYEETGNDEDAINLYSQSLEIRQNALGEDHPDYAVSLNNLAAYYTNRGYYEDALPLFLQAASVLQRDISQKSNYSATLNATGVVYMRLGDCRKAVQYYNQSLAIKEELFGTNHIDYADDLSNMAHAYECLDDLDSAELLYQQSNEIYVYEILTKFQYMNEKDKEIFYDQISYNFEGFNSFSLKRIASNPMILNKVYDLHIIQKGLLLDESKKFRSNILESGDTSIINQFDEWTSQKELLAMLYASQDQSEEVHQVEDRANELERSLMVQSAQFSDLRTTQQVTWKDIQNQLKPGEVAVEIIRSQIFDNEWLDSVAYFALIITPPPKERPGLLVFLDGKNLEGKYFTNYQNSLKFRIPDTVSYYNYWKPLGDLLKMYGNVNKIYFSADGIFNKINLAGLWNSESRNYVIDDFDIHIMSNTRDILEMDNHDEDQMMTASLFGFPAFDMNTNLQLDYDLQNAVASVPIPENTSRYFSRNSVSDLPGTKIEVDGIYSILESSDIETDLQTGEEANETNIKNLQEPDVLHIATHGFFLNDKDVVSNAQRGLFVENQVFENPLLRSGLLLAGANNTLKAIHGEKPESQQVEDGILTAYEVSNLNLFNTDLVVLSACETGLGEVKNGQGVYGLQRAFAVAGAKTLIMSLWKVSDEATQQLMTRFYGHLVENTNIRESFRLAQLELREEFDHPYYWAAFVIIGQ